MTSTPQQETFKLDQIMSAIRSFLEYGEQQYGKSQQGYFSDGGFAARALRYHLNQLAGTTPEAASPHPTASEMWQRTIQPLDGVAANYPVDAVRCAYERGRVEQAASLRAQIEQLMGYSCDPTWGMEEDPEGEFVKRADVLALLDITETR